MSQVHRLRQGWAWKGWDIKDTLEKLKRSAVNSWMVAHRDTKVLKLKWSWSPEVREPRSRRRWWVSHNNLARNLWLCVCRWWRGLSVFRCSRVDEQPVTVDTDGTAGYWTSFMIGKEKGVFLSAKSGMKMAEGTAEKSSSVQSSFCFQVGPNQSRVE